MMNLRTLQMINLAPRGVKGCCVPTSLCFITGSAYQDVDHLIQTEQYRYRRGKGVYTDDFIGDVKNIFGFIFNRIYKARTKTEAKRLYQIRDLYPKGTYAICIPRHMLVLKDGEFYDLRNTNINDFATDVWEVKKA